MKGKLEGNPQTDWYTQLDEYRNDGGGVGISKRKQGVGE